MSNENDNANEAIHMTRMLNYGLHAEQLAIPVLNEFQIIKSENPQIVFMAQAQAFIEQVVSDGPLNQNETFEDRIDLVVNNTKKYMKEQNMEDPDKNFFFYKDYKNDIFTFKIYVQDLIFPINGGENVIRQFNAYFLEPKFNDFYQITISVGPLPMPTEKLKTGIVDLSNDQITQILDTMMNNVLNNFKYR